MRTRLNERNWQAQNTYAVILPFLAVILQAILMIYCKYKEFRRRRTTEYPLQSLCGTIATVTNLLLIGLIQVRNAQQGCLGPEILEINCSVNGNVLLIQMIYKGVISYLIRTSRAVSLLTPTIWTPSENWN